MNLATSHCPRLSPQNQGHCDSLVHLTCFPPNQDLISSHYFYPTPFRLLAYIRIFSLQVKETYSD